MDADMHWFLDVRRDELAEDKGRLRQCRGTGGNNQTSTWGKGASCLRGRFMEASRVWVGERGLEASGVRVGERGLEASGERAGTGGVGGASRGLESETCVLGSEVAAAQRERGYAASSCLGSFSWG